MEQPRKKLLNILAEGGMSIKDLASNLNASEATVRRALKPLIEEGSVSYYRGKVTLKKHIENTIMQKITIEDGIEEPTAEDIANVLGISPEKVDEVLNIDKYKNALSLDQYFKGEDEDFSLLDKIPAGDYQEFINSYENKIMLSGAIQKLPPDLREIIELSYYEDLNQREISERINISQMQVSRRLKKALNRMYELIKNSEK